MTSVGCLILAHEQFLSSEVLLGLLLNCFFDHSTDSPDDQVIQARILNFLKKWCKIAWPSLCFLKLVNVLEEFLTFLCDNQSKYYNTLQSAVSEAKSADQFQPPTILNINNLHTIPRTDKAGHCSFADSRSLDLAQQLTLIDWEFLRAVHLHELVKCRWIKDKAPTLLRASKRVNDLAYWIAFQVVTVNQLKKRIKVLIKIIRLAKHLLELKSFNSLMAIYLALNFPALARLTHTWDNIGKRYLQQWKKISSILSPVRNFKEYHDLTDEMTPPMILCQEILLKDLLYYEQKSQFATKGAFNLERIYQIGSLIDRFRETQKVEFPILKSSVMYNYLLQIPEWENSEIATDVLDGQSRHIEPGLT
ncbi:ras guanine nucleotide exchange factor A-like isoform X2 [Schistocerca gregaria]|nr:ras guanine nucleotide exchange factor A-like isoform X2 [Schistocerca gregaria]